MIPQNWYLSKVRLGEWDRATDPDCQEIDQIWHCAPEYIDVKIVRVFSHESYAPSSENKFNDIAVLKLESTVEFTDFVRPICIDLKSSVNTLYGTVTAIGFGETEASKTSQRLLKAEIDIVNMRECRQKYSNKGRRIISSQICAIRNQADSCKGDSGGALMKQSDTYPSFWYLVGVTSFGSSDIINSTILI
jgi:secreted trypsin-like serine protease